MNEIQELYQQLIIDHGRHPRNFGRLDGADFVKEGFNPLCGDKLTLYLQMQDGAVHKAGFEGSGCAISMASASMMTEALVGLTIVQVETLFTAFHQLLTQDLQQDDAACLGKLMALAGVKAFPMRVKCATLAWHTLLAAIHQEQQAVCTE